MIHKLYAPGSVFGPCDEGCLHPRCEMEKMAAKQACALCKEPIGFQNDYTFVDDAPVHMKCVAPGGDEHSLPDEPPTTSKLC